MEAEERKNRLKDARDYDRITRMTVYKGQYREYGYIIKKITSKQIITSSCPDGISTGISSGRFGQFNQTSVAGSFVTLTTPSFLWADRLNFLARAVNAKALSIRHALALMKTL